MATAQSRASDIETRIGRVVFVCALIGFLALVTLVAAAGWSLARTHRDTRWVQHSYAVDRRLFEITMLIERAHTARRGFLLKPTVQRIATYHGAVGAIPAIAAELDRLTLDNPVQRAGIIRLDRLIADDIDEMTVSIRLAAHDRDAAIAAFSTDSERPILIGIRRLSARLLEAEDRLLATRVAAQRHAMAALSTVLTIVAAVVLLVGAFSIVAIRRYTASLVRSRDETARLAEELEDRVRERTLDLSRANEEIQRFAYIVSHDLRSPLVNVMGFTGELETAAKPLAALVDAAERDAPALLTAEARSAAREDLPEAIGFIRTSTQKMDRLINAILKLSREGRRVLAPEAIDLGALADGVVATLRHRLDEAGAAMTVERPMPPLAADRLAVEQIVSNLAENAVKYLSPGRPGRIAISARTIGDRVAIAIADNGRGIDPRDHDRVFDLFRRSGAQDQPGEGIGLAHVRALAYRLGGLVECRSAIGEGSTFTLTLPAVPPGTSTPPATSPGIKDRP